MEFLIPSFIAGVLTVLAPCTVILLPAILGGSLSGKNIWKPLIVAASLGVSVFVFTLLLKVGIDAININERVLQIVSGVIIGLLGLIMIFPTIWDNIQIKLGLYKSENLVHKTNEKEGIAGSIALGVALGPVFSTCSPTYFFIIGTILPQDLGIGLVNLAVYTLGLVLVLLLIGYGGRAVVKKLKFASNPTGWFKRILGILLVIIGIIFITDTYKDIEVAILDLAGDNYVLLEIEDSLLGR
ncbi:cytochrome C biogenesis protein [Candidatus Peregrinibacteria bacterium]|nr:cytochrome C biogenesis protein [Candidatus Peregrinibacteria bacterium]